jgi:pyruvate dehydrogenase E1 component beta subunit
MRPIVELMFSDFMGVCLDQIYNHMAKIHFESGGNVKVPMVLTMAAGGGYSDGAQHSQCLWGTFAHLPGMKVVVPSNPADAKGLMTSAIRDDSPVVYIFHKGVMGLPWMAKNPRSVDEVPDGDYAVPIGKARVARHGSDVTVVTLSLSVHHALDVAEKLAPQGIDVEVIDLRSLVPLDREAILSSVGKTGRLVVVDEDYLSFGVSGEVVATVAETDPGLLRSAPLRVAVPDVPIPYAHDLEYAVLPRQDRIEQAIRTVLGQ